MSRWAVFSPQFLEDLAGWVKTERKTALRLLQLLEAVLREPAQAWGSQNPGSTWSLIPDPGALRKSID